MIFFEQLHVIVNRRFRGFPCCGLYFGGWYAAGLVDDALGLGWG